MYAIRVSDPDKRVVCLLPGQPGRMGTGFGSTPVDIIASANENLRQQDFLDMLGQPGQK